MRGQSGTLAGLLRHLVFSPGLAAAAATDRVSAGSLPHEVEASHDRFPIDFRVWGGSGKH